MHEWAIAMSVVSSVEKWSMEKNVKVGKVILSVPSLSMLEVEILREAFNVIKKGSKIADAELEVRLRDQNFNCRVCGNKFTLSDIKPQLEQVLKDYGEENPLHIVPALITAFAKCPKCGSHDFDVDTEIRVEAVEL
ncbi:MAG: hydrogenase/urease maturation nickel metallochaperone HypA [Archaeoglobaceae archaeon]|nr:hydrogenase/urease maturation nickel metallochaperone HypA [Archaeoglobaceae archaeon]MDW8117782.1 hydrogenase/urease maturation nickel metallochaperone HypA [Archaeoglobaceae archaeon]